MIRIALPHPLRLRHSAASFIHARRMSASHLLSFPLTVHESPGCPRGNRLPIEKELHRLIPSNGAVAKHVVGEPALGTLVRVPAPLEVLTYGVHGTPSCSL